VTPETSVVAPWYIPDALPSCSARHWSPQNGGPKGKMIEGRSGGSGRGTRRESWAPPDSGCSPTDRRFVSCTTLDPKPFPAPPSHFLPSAASSPSQLLATPVTLVL